MKVGAVVLAAGNSVRYQGIKLLDMVDGRKMYQHILEKMEKLNIAPKVVVTQYEEIAEYAKEHGFFVVINERPEDGISRSIKLGIIEVLEKEPETSGILFTVSDQPYLSLETLERVMDVFERNKNGIVTAAIGRESGNPCLFGRPYFEELLCLSGDVGGKNVLKKHGNTVIFLQVDEEKELVDIDVRET